ncbi:hypothetical protein MTR67_043534 [Solanum verrucosum]|uniref:Tf2-1-like SH3-like domain-containing protein n=1 Tax=Solanum verrucosum TaxID=315347 RepID=A0AAF0ZV86_SOLVR|nr:hypothetical protein MTR67_043534 [Solanum verrucosum]
MDRGLTDNLLVRPWSWSLSLGLGWPTTDPTYGPWFSPRAMGGLSWMTLILRLIDKVAYELELPNELASMHPVFHVSMLKKCVGGPTSIVPLEGLGVDENLSYEDVPVEILYRQVKKLLP